MVYSVSVEHASSIVTLGVWKTTSLSGGQDKVVLLIASGKLIVVTPDFVAVTVVINGV